MKSGIHPRYETATVKCACGNEFVTRSTKKELGIVLCNECHPFYTGKQKFVDTAGRIEKFQRRFNVGEGQDTSSVVKETKKLSKKQIQSAAIQEEKRQKAARKARRDEPEAPAASASAPAEGAAAAPAADTAQ